MADRESHCGGGEQRGADATAIAGAGDCRSATDGSVAAVKYGAHAYDQWSVDELLDWQAVSVGVQGRNSSAE
jgi:hypothetical protein